MYEIRLTHLLLILFMNVKIIFIRKQITANFDT